MKRRMKPLIDRLMSKVVVDNASGCWNWTGSCRSDGYGQIRRGGRGNGITSTHRASYEFYCGAVPDGDGHHGICVLHRCDNKICVNPEHLFLGTQSENMDDKVAKGRQLRGETNNGAKLCEADVAAIRASDTSHGSGAKLANQFGVSQQLISAIRSGKIWAFTH